MTGPRVTLSEKLFTFQHRRAPYLFIAPFFVSFVCFALYPLIKSLILAFHATCGPQTQLYVALGNFRFLLADADFHKAVANTATFAAASLCVQLPLSLGLAMLLNRRSVRGRNLWRLCFFSPSLVGTVFVGMLFSLVFAPKFGLLNRALHALANQPIDRQWLSQERCSARSARSSSSSCRT